MQINRLFEIVYLLLERGSVTASELAERFEVSTRTVYRDVEALSEAGVPVYATRGRRGGISLMENFSLNRSLLTAKEQDEILFALQSMKATSAAECEGLLTRLAVRVLRLLRGEKRTERRAGEASVQKRVVPSRLLPEPAGFPPF